MSHFRCLPIPTETGKRWRATGVDDFGNTLVSMASDGAAPCRHCLREAKPGDAMLLGSYHMPGPIGIYWTPSPIFVHAEPCAAYDQMDHVPETVRARLVSVRAYDANQMCLYDLGQAVDGIDVDPSLARAISDPRTAFVNIHTAKPGCMLCRVQRG
ncbi:MAG: DUF1203 domain-containing protein [Acetobacteraceae bacterium]|nr:DUF1203 domain-containing protein [Acetobacteraceae bacterium]